MSVLVMPDSPHAPLDDAIGRAAVPYAPTPVPNDLITYRKIGPFSSATLPKGLLKDHQLKAGSWGRLTMLKGAIRFVWSDGRTDNQVEELVAGDVVMVPPQALHNLEETGEFSLEIEFLKRPE